MQEKDFFRSMREVFRNCKTLKERRQRLLELAFSNPELGDVFLRAYFFSMIFKEFFRRLSRWE